jgi:uncharacterized membrane protein
MSNAKLKKATRFVTEKAGKRKIKRSGKEGDLVARGEAESDKGQIFVINLENEAATVYAATGLQLTEEEKRKLFARLVKFLRKEEQSLKLDPEAKKELRRLKHMVQTEPGDKAFIVGDFNHAKRLKIKNKENLSTIKADYVNSLERRDREYTANEISLKSQLGHGDKGLAVSQFALEKSILEAQKEFGLSNAETQQMYDIVLQQRKKHKINVDAVHAQIVTASKLDKNFIFIITNQLREFNNADSHRERAAFTESLKELDFLGMETSTPLDEALAEVFADSIATKGSKVKGKRRKKVAESSKASIQSSKNEKKTLNYQVVKGAGTKKLKKTKAKKSPSSLTTFLGVLNQQLPRRVVKNMQEPSLVSRSGRFAASVRATDIVRTPQGFPSIGYTYMKNPYQTFEQGYRQGSEERDPRRLIDKSIRELATQFAIGRFYTRRV